MSRYDHNIKELRLHVLRQQRDLHTFIINYSVFTGALHGAKKSMVIQMELFVLTAWVMQSLAV